MRQSHREMCVTLRDGVHDEQIAALTSRPTVARRRRTEREVPAVGAATEPLAASFQDETPAQLAATRTCLSTLQCGVAGFLGAALVNQKTGTTVRALSNTVDMKVAVSGNAEVLQTKMRLLEQLSLAGTLEDILISLDRCFCIIRPLSDAFFLSELGAGDARAELRASLEAFLDPDEPGSIEQPLAGANRVRRLRGDLLRQGACI
ncbi:MAG: hypothetical protein KUG77_22695, partial [Nannocystaceae bacterium]|nr:hypothetical protein [Nannocystaceae bacterium]